MQRITQYWRVLGLAAIVAAALAIGGSQAFAAARVDCFYDPPWTFGVCNDPIVCNSQCVAAWYPEPAVGDCSSGCCICYVI